MLYSSGFRASRARFDPWHRMRRLTGMIGRFVRSEDGPTSTEYAVMLALVLIVALSGAQITGCHLQQAFQTIANSMGS